MPKASVINYGCRLNQYEADSLTSGLQHIGLELADTKHSNYIVLNTCTVTNKADHKSRNEIRKIHNLNPSAKIIVTGCYATTDPEEIKKLPGIYWVVDNRFKANIPQMIKNELGLLKNLSEDLPSTSVNLHTQDGNFGYTIRKANGNARAYLKIQDGCNKSCGYCKIPQARGTGKSRSYFSVLEEAKQLIDLGFHELIITGVNIGWYKSPEGYNFYDLVEAILDLSGDFYLRLSSIEPADVNERLGDTYTHSKMAKFLHIPLQSGSRAILKSMRRGYTPRHFKQWVSNVTSKCQETHIGTDIIVGYPGETEDHFLETIELSKELELANIHIFPYSKRDNTHALKLIQENRLVEINGKVIRKRVEILTELRNSMAECYKSKTAGKTFKGIVINQQNPYILSENFIRLSLKTDHGFDHGALVNVQYNDSAELINIDG